MTARLTYPLHSVYLGLILLVGCISPTLSQNRDANKLLKKGNDFYSNKKFNDAEVEYRKAIEKDKQAFAGKFNLGDALYKQGKFEDATKIFTELGSQAKTKEDLARVNHNLGNSLLKQEKYQESVEAYKKALTLNPKDEDTRYNMAYALKMIPKQKQQQEQQNKDKQNKEQDKQNQQQQNQDNKDQKDKGKENQPQDQKGKEDEKDGQQQKPSNQMSEEQAKQMLEALGKNEKDVQDKMKKVKAKGVKVKPKKDW
jgi:Ca-activated chloride channel family protein